jgi:hypothetical protein
MIGSNAFCFNPSVKSARLIHQPVMLRLANDTTFVELFGKEYPRQKKLLKQKTK